MTSNIPPELVAELKERFPNQCPDEDDSDRKIWINVGMCRLIEYLDAHCQRQQETILTKK